MNFKIAVCGAMVGGTLLTHGAFTNFINFETAPVHPISLGPDGHTLAVCNLPDARVELFDVSNGIPFAVGSVAVGIDPVTARFASSNELWVVNHISSTISIIDIAARNIIATLETPAGPSDLVFAGNPRRAWITCSRTNAVFVVDPLTRTAVTNIAIDGERPRSMAVSPDGSKVYVAIFESGNGSTTLSRKLVQVDQFPVPGPVDASNGPYGGVNPPPNSGANFFPARNLSYTNLPPKTALIVKKNGAGRWMDDNNQDWTEWISGTNAAQSQRIQGWDLPDRDVAIIDTTSIAVSYAQRLMNLCMAIAVNPASGEITVVGTDGTNEKRFEPVLNGVFLRVELALVDPITRTNRLRDLNPHLDYLTRTLPQNQRALGLGDPRGIEWNSNGTRAYITGMGSRNMIVVDANGTRINAQPIELPEGPTGLALDEARSRVYVWNRFSSSISVVDTAAGVVATNVPVFDPTPDIVRRGRRHLYDTRKTSGLGIASCASCHPEARMDRLAWDLGDPAGPLVTITNQGGSNVFHPMKGPMVTLTLQDIITPTNFNGRSLSQAALHWRGDRTGIEDFNQTFTNLQANDVSLTTNEMADFKEFLASIFFAPNFYRTFSNTMPSTVSLPGLKGVEVGGVASALPPGNPQNGQFNYAFNCAFCHDAQSGRGNGVAPVVLRRDQDNSSFQFAQFRNLFEKLGMDRNSTNSRSGFGFFHDGREDTLTHFLKEGFQPSVAADDQRIADTIAFLFCFRGSDLTITPAPAGSPHTPSQDTPAAVGRQITLSSPTPPTFLQAMADLAMKTNSRVELVVRGKKTGVMRSWLLQRGNGLFQSDRNGEVAASLVNLTAAAGIGNEFTATLVPEGSGPRLALDRDGDGYFDATETEMGYDPANPESHPGRIVSISKTATNVVLAWESVFGLKYSVETTTNFPVSLSNTWSTLTSPFTATTNVTGFTDAPPNVDSRRFYRIRKEP